MFKEGNFEEYGYTLSQGLFADRVLLSLIRVERHGQVSEQDEKVFSGGSRFFASLVEIVQAESAESLPIGSQKLAKDLKIIWNATRRSFPTKEDFSNFARMMRDGLESITAGNPNREILEELEGFFERYGAEQYQRADMLSPRF